MDGLEDIPKSSRIVRSTIESGCKMLKFDFSKPNTESLNIICLGAHSDDIEIGCGGTILRLIEEYPKLEITWIVFSAVGERAVEAQKSAETFLSGCMQRRIVTKDFRDGYFPYTGAAIKDFFESLKLDLSPDLIFTHYREDSHQDHRLICELTWNTWRNHFILEYEIPKFDGDLGNPNFFVSLDNDICEKKIELLMRFFQTQANKHWFSPDTFNASMRVRGIQCKAPEGYSEAFYSRKLLF